MRDVSPARWKQLDGLVEEALERPSDERTAFLRATCGRDLDLYSQSAALLRRMEEARNALGESATDYAAPLLDAAFQSDDEDDGLKAGAEIGVYRVLRELGRGGMGAVYLAERADGTFEREVALKLVKRGMDTEQVVRRFRRERRILAGLDHPGIARLLDAGAAPDGRPFLVMECVEGEPITAYADRLRLSLDARLALFDQVCEAVRYAHHRLVIHRDLKPSNILVTEVEGAARVKLLDFGIARLLVTDSDESVTSLDARVLTPAYAAPEQLRGEAMTTAADVYALGIVLYELLAGRRPARPAKAPSSLIGEPVAQARSTTAAGLSKKLRGDLDTIALKSLREDPEQRYPSVQSLLEDLGRVRGSLPILASNAPLAYRVRKFLRRYRVQIGVGALIAVALLSGAAVALWQAQEAKRSAERSDNVRDFLVEILEAANPDYARDDSLAVGAMLELASSRIENELANEPELQAELMGILAEIYRKLDRYDRAAGLFERAIDLERRHGNSPIEIATLLNGLAGVRMEEGAFDESERLYLEALELRREHAPGTEDLAMTTANLGNLYRIEKRVEEADSFLTLAADMQREIGIEDRSVFAITVDRIASLRRLKGRYAEAEDLSREALALRLAALEPNHRHVFLSKNNLGLILFQSGQIDPAAALYEEVYAFNLERFGRDNRETATALLHLGEVALERGRYADAQEYFRDANEIYVRLLGNDHPTVAITALRMSAARLGQRDLPAAKELALRALAIYTAAFDGEHQDVAEALSGVGDVFLAEGNLDEAERRYARSLEISRVSLPPGHPNTARPLVGLGRVRMAGARTEDAEVYFRDAVAILEKTLVPGALETAEARLYLGQCLSVLHQLAEARALLSNSLDALRAVRGDDDLTVREARSSLTSL